MTQRIARFCAECKEYGEVVLGSPPFELRCPQCHSKWGHADELEQIFEHCPICQCRQFYTAKDFNHFIGCLVVLLGIAFVPLTYGLSLPVFALIDWLIYRRVPSLICCYRCGTEFRGSANSKGFKPFMHHIGLKYDKYR